MDYATYQSNACDIIELHHKFNVDTVNDVKAHFEQLIDNHTGDVLVDMSSVNELDSSGIGALVFLYKRLKVEDRNLGLLGVNGKPDELLTMLRINQTIKQYESIEDYLGSR